MPPCLTRSGYVHMTRMLKIAIPGRMVQVWQKHMDIQLHFLHEVSYEMRSPGHIYFIIVKIFVVFFF
jgi:hypothetical protein